MKTDLMTKTLAVTALASLALLTTAARADWGRGYAQPESGWEQPRHFARQVNARQDRQMDRIRAGMHSGKLTRAEFRDLIQEQHQIRAMERHFRADGVIDAREFRRLERALDLASHHIKAEKHDRQLRYAYTPRRGFD